MAKKKFRSKPLPADKPAAPPAFAFDKSIFDIEKPRSIFLISLLLFALTAWVFSPALQCPLLIFDEFGYVFKNPHVNNGIHWDNIKWAFLSLEYSNWYPLTWISHMLDVQFYGWNAWGHHLTNVLLHAANTVLVFLVFRKLTGATWRSLMMALFFGLHPLRVESVAWISERKDVLSTFFWLSAMWAYARFAAETKIHGGKAKWFYGLTLFFLIMGLMSKTMLVTLPFVFLLLDYWPLKRWEQKSRWNLLIEKVPFFLPVIGVSILSCIAQQRGGMTHEMINLSLPDRLENAVISYVRYLGKFFWPENLCVYYPHPGHWPADKVILAGLFVAGVSLFAWLKRKSIPYLFVGWFWFLGTLVPVINLVQLGSQSIADRYTYVPIIGICLLVSWGLWELTKQWRQRAVVLSVAVAAAVIVCAALTRYEIQFWKSDVKLWSRAIAVTDGNYVAHCNLGMIVRTLNPQWALNEFQQSDSIYPYYAEAQKALANLLVQGRFYPQAIAHGQVAVELDPSDPRPLFDISCAYRREGNYDEAIRYVRKAISLDPHSLNYQATLCEMLVQSGHGVESIPFLEETVMTMSNQPIILNALGVALIDNRQYDEAITNFQKALQIIPDLAIAKSNLIIAINLKNQPSVQANPNSSR